MGSSVFDNSTPATDLQSLNWSELHSTSINATVEEFSPLQVATTVVVTTSLALVMFSMGCTIELQQLWNHIRHPLALIVGMGCQFVLLPLLAFVAAYVLQLPPVQAVGMLIMSCCPGGSMSNLFTHWSNGDVALSLSMTTLSTLLAMGALPLNLLVYAARWTSVETHIPFTNLLQAFALTIVPASIGIFFKDRLPRVARVIVMVGDVLGTLSVVASMVLISVLYPQLYNSSWRIYLAALFIPFSSFGVGMIFPTILRMPPGVGRAIALETGIQNFPLCMAILTLTYPRHLLKELSVYPLLFGVFIFLDSFVFVLVYRLTTRYFSGEKPSGVEFQSLPHADHNEEQEEASCSIRIVKKTDE